MSKPYKGKASPEIMYRPGSYIPSFLSEINEKYQDENSRYNCVLHETVHTNTLYFSQNRGMSYTYWITCDISFILYI